MSLTAEQLAQLSADEKRALLARLQHKHAPRIESFPLSFAQERLWFLDQLIPGADLYTIPLALRLCGPLDCFALECSLNEIARRHETLRTTFALKDGQPAQLVDPLAELSLPLLDLSEMPAPGREAALLELAADAARNPFDLGQGPLVRAALVRLTTQEHVLLLMLHHIIADGWSIDVLIDELAVLYTAFVAGGSSPLPELPIQYADFALWQREHFQGEGLAQQLDYWKRQLQGLGALEVPADFTRPPVQTFRGAAETCTLPPALGTALAAIGQRTGATMFMTLLSAFQLLLARYTGQDDIAVGSIIANRAQPETQRLIGLFVNMLVLRTGLSGNPSFHTLLQRVRRVCLDAYMHQDLPFEQLVQALQPERQLNRHPLVQTAFAFHPAPATPPAFSGLSPAPLPLPAETVKYDLALSVGETAAGLRTVLEFSTELFSPTTIRRMLGHWQTLLEGIVADPQRPISDLPLLTQAERRQVLVEWNDIAVTYPQPHVLHRLIETQVERSPEEIALVFEGRRMSYRELNERANQLAHFLIARGVTPETLVGIAVERSFELVIGLLGILKAGGAYVPLDPSYPRDRLAFMIADAGAPVLLTMTTDDQPPTTGPSDKVTRRQGDKVTAFSEEITLSPLHPFTLSGASVVDLVADWPTIVQAPAMNPQVDVTPAHLAYMIYTSGSTGRPKGGLNSHAGIANRLLWMQQEYGLTSDDRVLQKTPFSFDVSVWEFFWPLMTGARLVIARPEGHRDAAYLADLIAREGVTTLHFVPSMLQIFLEEPDIARCTSLRRVICSGEVLPYDLQQRFFTRCAAELHNLYGPTEAAVDVTFWACQRGNARRIVPIGRPVANTQIYILDRHMRPVPIGVAGELYIGGVQVGRGYWRRPDLTAEKFVPNPFAGIEDRRLKNEDSCADADESLSSILYPLSSGRERLYRTGDLCRFLPDGSIEYLGRIDNQIKLRGLRIELGEIEAALTSHPQVREAVALVREIAAGDMRIVAYLVQTTDDRRPTTDDGPQSSHSLTRSPAHPLTPVVSGQSSVVGELRAFLAERLPEYMMPAHLIMLEELPLNPSGKVDRRALAVIQVRPPAPAITDRPRNGTEHAIAAIWQEVLGLPEVGREDNFFDVGGHSLLMVQVRNRIAGAFGCPIALLDLFRYPNVSALAGYLDTKQAASPAPAGGQSALGPPPAVDRETAIAVIGMAGRFPGAPDIETFWKHLSAGVEQIRFFTDAELVAAGVDSDSLRDPRYVKAYGMLEGIEAFDAPFFNMTPREARVADPQQRFFLECAWAAIEHAGYNVVAYPGRIGLFAGSSISNYAQRLTARPGRNDLADDLQIAISTDKDYLTTRVSYKLNLTGPSVNVQSACSTSLVAVHLACRSLLDGDCDMALAGGVSVKRFQPAGYWYEEGGILSPDGHCRAFDARAQGTVSGDGVGIVVLKPLVAAMADGDYIYAVIKGSAINNDGAAKVGYTAPSIEGQAAVISAALAAAALDPATIGYIEAHGTGTALGDPIEVAALTQVFRAATDEGSFCALGAVKSAIGHLDVAAGVAGLIKAVLAVEHRTLPASPYFKRFNPEIDAEHSPFYVTPRSSKWMTRGGPRRAGVSSFGIGGTNAHVVLEEAPPREASGASRAWQLLLLSARSAAALATAAANLAAYLRRHPGAELADVAYTLQIGRKAFDYRRAVICQDVSGALAALEAPSHTAAPARTDLPVMFLFPGQGAQHPGMAWQLYQTEPLFRQHIDRCAELLAPELGLDVREVLYPHDQRSTTDRTEDRGWRMEDGSLNADHQRSAIFYPPSSGGLGSQWSVVGGRELDQTWLAQPALFAIEYALAQLLISWGIRPRAMLGHSIGEYVAACLAGVFSLEDALRLVARRGRLVQQLPSGAMLAVPLPEHELQVFLGAQLALAAVNGPALCVVAGPHEAIGRLEASLAAQSIEARRLHTSHAFHSPLIEPAVEPFARLMQSVELYPPRIPYISNLTGTWITAAEATDPRYWSRHLRQTVRFAEGVEELLRQPAALLEIGPGQTLSAIIRRRTGGTGGQPVLASLPHPREQQSDVAHLLQAVGQLWGAGVPVDWGAMHAEARRLRVPLPTYPFERQRYWVEATPEVAPAVSPKAGRRPFRDWFYAPFWRQSPPPDRLDQALPCNWLIMADSCGVGERLACHARSLGHNVVTVRPGARFDAQDDQYTIDLRQRQSYDRLIQALIARGQTPAVIAHVWSVTPDDHPCAGVDGGSVIQELGLHSLLFLAQALADQSLAGPLTIGVISNGMQRIVGNEARWPEKATVLGLCTVIGQEYPQITCRSIDIAAPDPQSWQAQALAEQLTAELLAPSADPVVAYRDDQRWVQSFEPVRIDASAGPPARLREGGVYLITGGLGGIGLALAAYLAQAVRARLVLVGRSALPPRIEWRRWLATHAGDDRVSQTIRSVQAIEQHGAQTLLCSADVADLEQMRGVIQHAHEQFGTIHGVIHAAGIPGGGVIPLQSREKLAAVLAPKLQGTLVLDRLLSNTPLDFLVLCSSVRSIMGGFGTADYCAANAFLDLFARCRPARPGQFTVAINWDSWHEVGMSAATLARLAPADAAAQGMQVAEGVEVFRRVLDSRLAQIAVATVDLHTLVAQAQAEAAERASQVLGGPAIDTGAHTRPDLGHPYVAPGTALEETIAAIWRELLGIGQIGVADNFFELGGDSIVSLQVAARARRLGLRIRPQQLFEHPTIAQLALVAERLQAPQAEQEPLSGPLPLTPTQSWFFEHEPAEAYHWNQSMLLLVHAPVEGAALERALQALPAQHDALRLRFERDDLGWRQTQTDDVSLPLTFIDLSSWPETEQPAMIMAAAAEVQASLNLTRGPLARAVLFDCGPQQPARLLLVIHHLAIDAVAWGILLEDLTLAYQQARRGTPIALPDPTASFRQWARRLHAYAQQPEVRHEIDFWLAQGQQHSSPLPIDHSGGPDTVESTHTMLVTLAPDLTSLLLHELPAMHVQPNDLLLTALAQVFSAWTGEPALWIDLEGHGREELFNDIDLSRTVGWFTSIYPVCLRLDPTHDSRAAVQVIKEHVRSVSAHAMSYGLLRYLSEDRAAVQQLAALPRPELLFLYLGRTDQQAARVAGFTPAPESTGPGHSPRGRRFYRIEISSWVAEGRLRLEWRYSTHRYRPETIADLASAYLAALESLIGNCLNDRAPAYIPSDFPYASLSQEELDELVAGLGDIDPAQPN